jgi:hypothetical protein
VTEQTALDDCAEALKEVDTKQREIKDAQAAAEAAAKEADARKAHAEERGQLLEKVKTAADEWDAARTRLLEDIRTTCDGVHHCEERVKSALGDEEVCAKKAHEEYEARVEERTKAEAKAKAELGAAQVALAAAQKTLDDLVAKFNERYGDYAGWVKRRTDEIKALLEKFKAEMAKGDCEPQRAYLLLLDAAAICCDLDEAKEICLPQEMLDLLVEIEKAQDDVAAAEHAAAKGAADADAASKLTKELTDDRVEGMMVLFKLCRKGGATTSTSQSSETTSETASAS